MHDMWHFVNHHFEMTITVIYGPLLSESVISFGGERLPKPACSSHLVNIFLLYSFNLFANCCYLHFNLPVVEKQPCFIGLGETLKVV